MRRHFEERGQQGRTRREIGIQQGRSQRGREGARIVGKVCREEGRGGRGERKAN